jgi:hypothetical protein
MAFKQVNVGSWLGAAKIVIGQAGQYISYITLLFAGIAAYPVIAGWASAHDMVLQFWQFVVVAVVLILGICIGEYIVGQAPTYTFWWEQSLRHAKPLQGIDDRMKRIEQNQKKIMKKMGIKG